MQLSAYIDGVSALMLSLVTSVGWVICKFSIRYLDGEQQQGNYFRWAGSTIAAVSLFVIAGNLPLMILELHQLLVHYGDRPAAHRAAAFKFAFSRLGDTCLLVASELLFRRYASSTWFQGLLSRRTLESRHKITLSLAEQRPNTSTSSLPPKH